MGNIDLFAPLRLCEKHHRSLRVFATLRETISSFFASLRLGEKHHRPLCAFVRSIITPLRLCVFARNIISSLRLGCIYK